MSILDEFKKQHGVEWGYLTILWLPSPVQVAGVRLGMYHAILALLDCAATRTIVSWAECGFDPVAIKIVTLQLCRLRVC